MTEQLEGRVRPFSALCLDLRRSAKVCEDAAVRPVRGVDGTLEQGIDVCVPRVCREGDERTECEGEPVYHPIRKPKPVEHGLHVLVLHDVGVQFVAVTDQAGDGPQVTKQHAR